MFGIFFGFDFNEAAFNRLFHGSGEIIERFYFLAVDLEHGQIRKLVISDGVVGRKHLTQNHDAAMFARKKLRLKAVEINETLGRFPLPVRSPFLKILAG